MWPIVTRGVAWSVNLSVGRSVMVVIAAKTADPIEVPFGIWTPVGPRNHILRGVQTPVGIGSF